MYISDKKLQIKLVKYEEERLQLMSSIDRSVEGHYLKESFRRICYLEGCIAEINSILGKEED